MSPPKVKNVAVPSTLPTAAVHVLASAISIAKSSPPVTQQERPGRVAMALAFVLSVACGGTSDAELSPGTKVSGEGGTDSALATDDVANTVDSGIPEAPPESGPDVDVPSPVVTVRIVATTAEFAHSDGLAAQTAIEASGGIRSLQLLTERNDASPITVFDKGGNPVEVGFDDGDDTVMATTGAKVFRPGHYTLARMVQSFSRYRIAATRHTLTTVEEGELSIVQVMGNGTWVDGELHDAGYYRYVFAHGSEETVSTGTDWVVPTFSTTAGATAVIEGGQWAVYFPVDIDVAAPLEADSELRIVVNMDKAFRWVDQAGIGYQDGVFDITPISGEPVIRFGGNEFVVSLTAR